MAKKWTDLKDWFTAKKWRMIAIPLAAVLLLAVVVTSIAMCGKDKKPSGESSGNETVSNTYRTFTTLMPSNWNELTYQDNTDTQILNYIGSTFFTYDYEFDAAKGGKYNEDGSINADAIVTGSFTTNYNAATKLEDVTKTVDKKWGYTDKQKEEGGYAWKITLRQDLKWDDGTPIDAEDFVYSMKEQLNPDFMNYRADTYYNNIFVKNAKKYLYHKTATTFESVTIKEYETVEAALAANETVYLDVWGFWNAKGYTAQDGTECPQYLSLTDQTVYDDPSAWEAGEPVDAFSGASLWADYKGYLEVGGAYASYVGFIVDNEFMDVNSMDMVGLYAPSKYELVLCMDSSIQALKKDGSLSYLAAYYLSSLPLVKEDLYEKCKKEPAAGSTLWTTNYNSSLATSASWGPYKVAQFQGGKSYTLVKNDNWFGYGMEEYKNQYNIDKIECELVAETDTQWMGFLSGKYDSITIDTNHLDYVGSKYSIVDYGSTAYGIQIYSNLEVLKESGRNNGILAIQDFRQALSLSMNRDDFNLTVFGTLPPAYGLIGEGYYSDIENGVVYRETEQAKKVLLRTYGFTENEDATWTDGTNQYATVDDAYEAMNGYNPKKAKEYLLSAITELESNPEKYGYDPSKKITLLYGATNTSETSVKKQTFMQKLVDELTKGTSLEGKIEIKMDTQYASTWSDSFKSGAYDLCIVAGIGGNIFNPFNTIGAFVNPNDTLKFSSWWDSSQEMITFKMPEGDYEGAGQEHTMSVVNWYFCLNGNAEANKQPKTFNWGANVIPYEARLEVLAMLEEYALSKFFSIQCSFDAIMNLDSAKFSNISSDYNTFMGYGGIRYSIVNYNDTEWEAFVKANNNNLEAEYKKQ